jgi:hypothetical protein
MSLCLMQGMPWLGGKKESQGLIRGAAKSGGQATLEERGEKMSDMAILREVSK